MEALYRNKHPFLDFSGFETVRSTMINVWQEFRTQLSNGLFSYADIEKAKKNSTYLRVLEEILVDANGLMYFSKTINDYNNDFTELVRGAILKPGEIPTFSRFIPNKDYMKRHNRFSPPGIEWLYMSLGEKTNMIEDNLTVAKNCSIRECGCKVGDRFGAYRFIFNNQFNDLKLINLTFAAERTYDEINSEAERRFQDLCKRRDTSVNEVEKIMLKWSAYTYAKLLSEEIFLPVECDNKEYEYAPFQTMAQYFISLGFSGIIYSSAVYPKGKNIVLFDKTYAKPCNDYFEIIIK